MSMIEGAKAILEGFGVAPPPQEVAQARADVCKVCPQNYKGAWAITSEMARIIRAQREKKLEMKLRVEGEEQLGTCRVCKCFLPLKLFFDINTIFNHTSDDLLDMLETANPKCWIVKECRALKG